MASLPAQCTPAAAGAATGGAVGGDANVGGFDGALESGQPPFKRARPSGEEDEGASQGSFSSDAPARFLSLEKEEAKDATAKVEFAVAEAKVAVVKAEAAVVKAEAAVLKAEAAWEQNRSDMYLRQLFDEARQELRYRQQELATRQQELATRQQELAARQTTLDSLLLRSLLKDPTSLQRSSVHYEPFTISQFLQRHGVSFARKDKDEYWRKHTGCRFTSSPPTGQYLGERDNSYVHEVDAALEALAQNAVDGRPPVVASAAAPGTGKSAWAEAVMDAVRTGGRRGILSDLIPIPVTFNMNTALEPVDLLNFPNIVAAIEANLAVRVLHSAFITPNGEPKPDFSEIFDDWVEVARRGQAPHFSAILKFVQDALPDGKEMLLVVDEAARTLGPGIVRDFCYKWLRTHKKARLLMTSLNPTALRSGPTFEAGRAISPDKSTQDVKAGSSDFLWTWVPLRTQHSKTALEQLVGSLELPYDHYRSRARFLFDFLGLWRARAMVFGDDASSLLSKQSAPDFLEHLPTATRRVKKAVSLLFHSVTGRREIPELLAKSVLRVPVELVSADSSTSSPQRLSTGHHPSALLLAGVLSNGYEEGRPAAIPRLPLILVDLWSDWVLMNVHPNTDFALARSVQNLLNAAGVRSEPLRLDGPALLFEQLIARWFELFVHCALQSSARSQQPVELQLITPQDGAVSICVLFPFMELEKDCGGASNARCSIFEAPHVYQLNRQLSTLDDTHVNDLDPVRVDSWLQKPIAVRNEFVPAGTIFFPAKGEAGADLFWWLPPHLLAVQCRLWGNVMPRRKLTEDLRNLCKFRDRLWLVPTNSASNRHNAPVIAKKLGLPAIQEGQVVYVLLAPKGLASKASSVVTDSHFQGSLLVPGMEDGRDWLAAMLGPTFHPLLHLLQLQMNQTVDATYLGASLPDATSATGGTAVD